MEQKKTLWIALSAGVFLLFVFGAAIFIYSSGTKKNVPALALKDSGQIWVAPTSSSDSVISGLMAPADNTAPAVTSGINDLPGGANDNSALSSAVSGTFVPSEKTQGSYDMSSATNTETDNVVKTESLTVIATNANVYTNGVADMDSLKNGTPAVTAQNEKAQEVIKETQNKKKYEEPASAKPKVASTATSADKAPAKKAPVASKPASSKTAYGGGKASSVVGNTAHYWVQVASYSAKNNADEARSALDEKDIPCEVFTFTKDSRLFYRVRVGPYKTKSEAEYWKKNVDAIEMFKSGQSYVVDSSARASR